VKNRCTCFFNLFKDCLEFVTWLLNYCRGIFLRSEMNSADFASNWRGRLVRGCLNFHTPCVLVVMRHVFRLTAWFKCVHQEWLSHIFEQPLLACKFVSVYKRPLTSLFGKIWQKMGIPATRWRLHYYHSWRNNVIRSWHRRADIYNF